MQTWQFLYFLFNKYIKFKKLDVLKPDVLKPEALKPDVLWVYWIFPPSRISDPDPGAKKAPDPGSGSATLIFCIVATPGDCGYTGERTVVNISASLICSTISTPGVPLPEFDL